MKLSHIGKSSALVGDLRPSSTERWCGNSMSTTGSALVTAVGARDRDWASPLSGSGGLTSIFRLGRSLPASWVASSAQCRAAYVFLSVCGLVGLQCVSGGASSVGDGCCVLRSLGMLSALIVHGGFLPLRLIVVTLRFSHGGVARMRLIGARAGSQC
ncbi:hypothetical protein F2Q70_00031468 [Brassica cretica]|uniref:Uncharacterized protein n=1 Tax=Brassica cretica TaxID=69181 RepID=A0A8S9H048_BRACR|nr:hypothetical protein F2Q70_00031468 [Brassica cretica]KAF2551199.1 hypothetical protein F2Q68_00035878 [Brassica cretica]